MQTAITYGFIVTFLIIVCTAQINSRKTNEFKRDDLAGHTIVPLDNREYDKCIAVPIIVM